jgi:hypothetical protein
MPVDCFGLLEAFRRLTRFAVKGSSEQDTVRRGMDPSSARELPSGLPKNSRKLLSAGLAMNDNLNPHQPYALVNGDSLVGLTGHHAETHAVSCTT